MFNKVAVYFLMVPVLLFCSIASAKAQTSISTDDLGPGYAEPNYRDLAQTLVAFRGHEMAEDTNFVDDYARILYCNLVRKKYHNDFEWARIRNALRETVNDNKDRFRRHYEFLGTLRLDRYDFETQTFPISKETAMEQIGAMIFFQTSKLKLCTNKSFSESFPLQYVLQLASPVTLTEVPISMDDAELLIQRLSKDKNRSRQVFVRFRIRIDGFAGFDVEKAILYGDITGIDIFLDKDKTLYVTNIPR